MWQNANLDAADEHHVWSSTRFATATASAAWLVYLAMAMIRCMIYGVRHPWMIMERHALTAVMGVGMAAGMHCLLRQQDASAMRTRLLLALGLPVLPSALLSMINYNVMFVFAPAYYLRDLGMDMDFHPSLLGELIDSVTDNYFIFTGWALLYTTVSHAIHTADASRRAAAFAAAARAAELRALRYQLDPHFLSNALNTVSGLILDGQSAEADRTVAALATFLRASLVIDANADIPLAEELRLQQLYLAIEQVRFPDRLMVTIDVPAALDTSPVPALILQPLLENSIRHGVARTSHPVGISVAAARIGDMLEITVCNNGPTDTQTLGHGVGLANVANRLALRYGPRALCDIRFPPDGGVCTTLLVPLVEIAT